MFSWWNQKNIEIQMIKLETKIDNAEKRLVGLELDSRETLGSLRELIGRVRIVLDAHDANQQIMGRLGESIEGIRRALAESSDRRVAAAANSVPVVNVFSGDQSQINQGQNVHGDHK